MRQRARACDVVELSFSPEEPAAEHSLESVRCGVRNRSSRQPDPIAPEPKATCLIKTVCLVVCEQKETDRPKAPAHIVVLPAPSKPDAKTLTSG